MQDVLRHSYYFSAPTSTTTTARTAFAGEYNRLKANFIAIICYPPFRGLLIRRKVIHCSLKYIIKHKKLQKYMLRPNSIRDRNILLNVLYLKQHLTSCRTVAYKNFSGSSILPQLDFLKNAARSYAMAPDHIHVLLIRFLII